jgi:hypothetical protein
MKNTIVEKASLKNSLMVAAILLVGLSSAVLAASGMAFNVFMLLAGGIALVIICSNPEHGIIVFLASFLLYYPESLRGSGFLTPNNLLGLVFCFLLYLQLRKEKSLWFLKTRQIQLMGAIGFVFVVSFLLARKPPSLVTEVRVTDLVRKEMWDYFTQFVFLIFMIHFIRTDRSIKVVSALIFSLITVSVFSAIFFGLGSGGDYRAASSFGIKMARNSNHLAYYCLFAITTLWYWRQETQSYLLRILSLPFLAVLVYLVFLSASRNAFLNLLLLAGIILVESGVSPGKIIATALLVGAIGLMVVRFVPEQNISRITALRADTSQKEAGKSMSERIGTLKTGIKMFTDNNVLVGVGPGNFRWMRLLYYDHKRVATHNSYLWALLTGGVIALGLYLLLFWKTWKDLRWIEKQPATGLSPPVWAVKTFRTTLLLFLFFSAFTEAWLEPMLFVIVGLTISMKRIQKAALQPASDPQTV